MSADTEHKATMSISPDELDELEHLALAAQTWNGVQLIDTDDEQFEDETETVFRVLPTLNVTNWRDAQWAWDARRNFMVAANPERVLRMVRYIKELLKSGSTELATSDRRGNPITRRG